MSPPERQRITPNLKKKHNSNRTSMRNADVNTTPNPTDMGIVYPTGDTAFKALLSARFCAAIWSHISDCDETFNYWEPTHYLLFGKGFQTWEYSPEYALRSYMYLLIHVIPAWVYHKLLQPNRLLIFYFTRCLLGLLCALCEVYFYKSVCREFGVQVGRLTLAFMVFGAGMFISSTAYLPSTFSMYMCLVSMGAWYHRKYELAVFTTALSSFLSWPFAALLGYIQLFFHPCQLCTTMYFMDILFSYCLGDSNPVPSSLYCRLSSLSVPIAVDMLFHRKEFFKFFQWSVISTAIILIPMVKMDSSYFGHLVVAPYNILLYNVFTSHGPDLYGTEPWTFYFINGFLNFNFVFVGALLLPLLLFLVCCFVPSKPRNASCLPYILSLLPLYLWIAVFFLQPHKEERFLFPVYPLICLCGAVAVDCFQKLWFRFFVRTVEHGHLNHYLNFTAPIMVVAITVCTCLGMSRILALYNGYHAPLDVFMELNSLNAEHHLSSKNPVNVCVGKEWHRFPSSFFLPGNNWQLQFLESEFRGQLPQLFSSQQNGTAVIPSHMNNLNQEEPSRYYDVNRCHFLVDLDLGMDTEREPNYSQQKDQWIILKSIPFLNTAKSHQFFRAFYVPYFSNLHCTYASYNLLLSPRLKILNADISKLNR